MTPNAYVFDWTLFATAVITIALCGLMIAAAFHGFA